MDGPIFLLLHFQASRKKGIYSDYIHIVHLAVMVVFLVVVVAVAIAVLACQSFPEVAEVP